MKKNAAPLSIDHQNKHHPKTKETRRKKYLISDITNKGEHQERPTKVNKGDGVDTRAKALYTLALKREKSQEKVGKSN